MKHVAHVLPRGFYQLERVICKVLIFAWAKRSQDLTTCCSAALRFLLLAGTIWYCEWLLNSGCRRNVFVLFVSSSQSRCNIKPVGGKGLNICRGFKVPDSDLACPTFSASFCLRGMSGIVRVGEGGAARILTTTSTQHSFGQKSWLAMDVMA